jgi:hypothetical protein
MPVFGTKHKPLSERSLADVIFAFIFLSVF